MESMMMGLWTTLLVTAVDLLYCLSQALVWEWWPGIIIFVGIITCIIALLIMADLFHLRRLAPRMDSEPQ